MSELRQNMATKEWVVIAGERAKRPDEYASHERGLTGERPAWVTDCPFCPGNEEPDLEVARVPEKGEWRVRVVRNKYPALDVRADLVRELDGPRRSISGSGYHEVVIESPRHNTCPALETPEEVSGVLAVLQQRGRAMAKDERVEHVIYFKNHGERAGTSLEHPHAQIVGLPVVPHDIRTRTEQARRHFDDNGSCVFCDMLADELGDARRLVVQTERFVAFVPYAATSPFHVWVLPRRHASSFLEASDDDLVDLGGVLRGVLRKLYVGLRDPDYNYVIRSAPMRDHEQDYLHWYITIIPRVVRSAGFELGSGMYINTALPETSAAFLRDTDEEARI